MNALDYVRDNRLRLWFLGSTEKLDQNQNGRYSRKRFLGLMEQTLRGLRRVLKPDGRAVISIANFESLGHKLGKNTNKATQFLPWRDRSKRQAWETPPDHTYRFDYALVKKVAGSHLDIEETIGISFLWGAPLWDRFLSALPRKGAFAVMGALDMVAKRLPSLSDVVLIRCRQKSS